ncbi:MAG: DUF5610 domain-containing protein [Stagnimonas sp.]|nr:DUF5610 domain-containing protein [Stagnimonas sp.]
MSNAIASPSSISATAVVGQDREAGRASGPALIAESKRQFNLNIVQTQMSVSFSAGNEPLALLLRSAVDALNDYLRPEFGDQAIENASLQDQTPEATAARIVSLSTGFFDSYRKRHPELSEEQARSDFVQLIGGGFEQGFRDAQGILKGLGVLGGEVASGIERTGELVRKAYAEFAAGKPEA